MVFFGPCACVPELALCLLPTTIHSNCRLSCRYTCIIRYPEVVEPLVEDQLGGFEICKHFHAAGGGGKPWRYLSPIPLFRLVGRIRVIPD